MKMRPQFTIWWYALLISFTGSLPPGTLNVSVAGLIAGNNYQAAIFFGTGAVLVEMVLVRLAVSALDRFAGFQKYQLWFRLFSILVLLLFAAASIHAALKMKQFSAAVPTIQSMPFVAGIFLSAINPLHLPFWIGWTSVLMSKGLMPPVRGLFNMYVAGIGTGTMLAFILYGAGGNYFVHYFKANQYLLNAAVGCALLLMAVIDIVKLLKEKFVRNAP
jgi:threonine/homoserine/homoserine lactone efflux protein